MLVTSRSQEVKRGEALNIRGVDAFFMRRSVKQAHLTNVNVQLLQPCYSEALSLLPAGAGDVEQSAMFASACEQLKLTPNKTIRS